MSDDLLDEVRAAAEALALAEDRRLAAVRAAFDVGCNRNRIAEAACMTRDGVYKLLKARA
jgi:hypothetical protein